MKYLRAPVALGVAAMCVACSTSKPETYQDAFEFLTPITEKLPNSIEEAKSSVFRIFVAKGDMILQGTAFLYGGSDVLITAAHVVKAESPSEDVKMILIGSDGKTYWDSMQGKDKAVIEFMGIDPSSQAAPSPQLQAILGPLSSSVSDFTVIRLKRSLRQKPLPPTSQKAPRGESVYALGFPANPLGSWESESQGLHITQGKVLPFGFQNSPESDKEIVEQLRKNLEAKGPFIFHNSAMEEGYSGGPLLNASGEVLGVNVSVGFAMSGSPSTQAHHVSIDAYYWIPHILGRYRERHE